MEVMVLLKWASLEQKLNQKSIIHRMPLRPVTALVGFTQIFVLQMNFIWTQNVILQADFELIAENSHRNQPHAGKRTNVAVNYTMLEMQ